MRKKNKSSEPSTIKGSIVAHAVSMGFDFLKNFIHDFERNKTLKQADKITEQFSTLEHLVLKLEAKMNENRKEIEALKFRILMGNIIIIGLLVAILIQYFV